MNIQVPLITLGALRLGEAANETDPQVRTERAVDDIVSAIATLEVSPRTLGRRELADLEIAMARLGRYLNVGSTR